MSETRRKIGVGMKVKVKSFNGELMDITVGKEYYFNGSGNSGIIIDDIGFKIFIRLSCCAHLNGGSWEIVE